MSADGASSWNQHLALPGLTGWLAVLQVEEQRTRRHGGTHGLVLVRFDDPAGPAALALAAAAISGTIRDIDFLALVDRRTFAVLALHCEDLATVVGRLRRAFDYLGFTGTTLIDGRPAGGDLRAVWEAMTGPRPPDPPGHHADFVASSPVSLN